MMKRNKSAILAMILVLLASSCQPAFVTSTANNAKVSPTLNAEQTFSRGTGVILIALDGARSDWIANYIRNEAMPNLTALVKRGVMATYMQTVEPPLVAPAYLSLSTGAFPSHTGLVTDWSRASQRAFLYYAKQLRQIKALPEPIWRTAMRNGLRAATLFWPSANLNVTNLRADYMVTACESDVPAAQHVISFQEAVDWRTLPPSFSPPQEGQLRIVSQENSTVALFNVLAIDSLDDGTSSYDLLIFDTDKDLSNGHIKLPLGKWATVMVSPRLHSGAYLCFTMSNGVTATVYQSKVYYNRARPNDLLKMVNAQFGFPPPVPDAEALRAGWLSPQQYYEMAEIRAKWMMDVVRSVYQTYHPDLMFTAQSIIAECTQPFLLVDERQEGYTPEKAKLYAAYLQKAYIAADKILGYLLSFVDLDDSVVFVVSARGMMPVHTTINLNTILNNAQLLQLRVEEGQAKIDESKSKAMALACGGSAHIYINLQGRNWPGLVALEDYVKVQQQIIQALEEIKDADGQSVFAHILKHEDLNAVHLESSNSGDIFVQAAPGYCFSDVLGVKKVLSPSPYYAEAGFASVLPEMHAIFIAAGNNLMSGRVIPPTHVVDIAPTIAKVLQFQPASTVDGHVIDGIWR